MSRTYRRKNYEAENQTSWHRRGSKIAGFYTVIDHEWSVVDDVWHLTHTLREPTAEELKRKRYTAHGESRHGNDRSPGIWYRNNRMRQNRRLTRQELSRFMRFDDYEPMVEREPRSCLWDWR